MSYTTGLGAVKANLEAMEAAGRGQWLNDLYWDGKKSAAENKRFVRFLTDGVISIGFHEYIPSINGKKQDFICARQLANPRDCFICDNVQVPNDDGVLVPAKPRTLTVGLVALRNEIIETVDGRPKARYEDVMVEIEVEDEKTKAKSKQMVRDYRVIRQSQKTFWANVHGYFARWGTIIDRDYEISRTGSTGSNTVYTIIPCDPIQDMETEEQLNKVYGDVPETLVAWVERMGGKKRYDKFLTGTGGTQSSESSGGSATSSGPTTESSTTVQQGDPEGPVENQTSFGGLKDKLMQYTSDKAGSTPS